MQHVRNRRPSPLRLAVVLATLCGVALAPTAAYAKGCSEGTPASEAPQSLWGSFKPVKILTDSSRYTGQQLSTSGLPIHTYLDIENGYLFVSFFSGFSIWDVRGSKAQNPELLGKVDGWAGGFAQWVNAGEFKDMVFGLDAPTGDDSILAVAASAPVGFSIWNTTNKHNPKQYYQDHSVRHTYQVYAATIGGRQYAFVADQTGSPGLHVYDMTAAKAFTANACVENVAAGERNCAGVYLGKIGSNGAKYVSGVALGSRHYIAVSTGFSPKGIEVWDVTTPAAPRLVTAALGNTIVWGNAMWSENGKAYLGLRTEGGGESGKIYELTNCGGNGCTGMQEVSSFALPSSASAIDWKSVTFSRSDNTPFLHFGDNLLCAQGLSSRRHESIYDVTNPASPDEISPTHTIAHPDDPTLQVDYWSWSYSTFTKGYSHVAPRAAKFYGNVLYRAASSLLDAHEWVAGPGQPPAANFTWSPNPAYVGDPVQFTDTSTGGINSRSWTFAGGTPGTSSQTNPAIVFSSAGSKSVSLETVGGAGTDTEVKSVTILDPSPAIGGITKNVANPLVCQPITFTANGVTGKPPLGYAWEVRQNGQPIVPAPGPSNANPFVWSSNNTLPGDYTVHLTVNGAGTPATASLPVTLAPLPALPTAGSFTPSNSPFTHGTVQFAVVAPGATEWRWDFGDGAGFGAWTSDPVNGPNPSHKYSSIGTKNVKVQVRNCQNLGGVESAVLPVTINQIAALKINQFQADPVFGAYSYPINYEVTFKQTVEGDPTSFEYDWNGDGVFEQTSATAVLKHTYTQASTGFQPRMRIKRGSEPPVEVTHAQILRVEAGGGGGDDGNETPSLAISGPSSRTVDQAGTFTASAANCNPSSTGWNWTSSGATISGNGSSSVSISWPSAGSKTVRVTNSGCGGASAQKSVTVNGSENPSGLKAEFSFAPTAPKAGQVVSFNGAASTGAPTSYSWAFGDGSTAVTTTPATSHTYAAAGSYAVKLTVEKAVTGGGCQFGVCAPESASITKTVTVTGSEAQLDARFTFQPTEPQAGQPVSFDASTSVGGPTLYRWSFGDGGSAEVASPTVQHTFAGPGSYTVTLTVEKAVTGAGCQFGVCAPQTAVKQLVLHVGDDAAANGCTGGLADDPDKLCLGDGRYIVEVDWDNYHSPTPNLGEGQFRRLGGSESTGFFWFFNPDSIDLIVKIIDGSSVNEHVWVFYGALTDVIYDLKVTDTLTQQTKTYQNRAGSICGRGDTAAFSTAGLSVPATAPSSSPSGAAGELEQATGEAEAEDHVLYLLDGRFRVKVDWENHHAPTLQTGVGRSVTGTDGSGYFWFFEKSSLDLVVKMIDAREFDGHFWVFYGGLSDVKYSIEIEDLLTGETWERQNPRGSICGGSDTAAFTALGN